MALSGHRQSRRECPLLEVKRTCSASAYMSAKCHKQTLLAEKKISISPVAAVCGFPGLLAQDEWMQSPSHRETGEKDIGVILVGDDLSNERIPDVLIARDQPNCRGDGEVVEDFHAFLI